MTDSLHSELDKQTVTKAYARWAPVYDLVFGAVFERGRQAAIEAAERIGGRILEVGVGTGISLPDYSRANRICGVDISEPMLQKARERVAALAMTNVEGLWVMDAEHLAFPDESFDVVVAQYVVTTVPNPEATLDEFARVLKPGGEIVLVSRVGAEAGLRGRSRNGSPRRRESSAGAPSSRGNAMRIGPTAPMTCGWRNGALCRLSATSPLSVSPSARNPQYGGGTGP